MSDKDYALEDVCVALDAIEAQLKRLVEVYKADLKTDLKRMMLPDGIAEIDQI